MQTDQPDHAVSKGRDRTLPIMQRFALDTWQVSETIPGRRRFDGLDGIRAIAILLVVLSHSIPVLNMDSPLKRCFCVFSSNGAEGVWLFFVLSGFLISYPFFKRLFRDGNILPDGYVTRRAAKVIPPYYLSIIALTVPLVFIYHSRAPFISALETMAFFNIFIAPSPEISTMYWSLAAEVSFYVFLPLFFLAGRPAIKRWPWLVPITFLGVQQIASFAASHLPGHGLNFRVIWDVLINFNLFGWGTLFSILHIKMLSISPKLSAASLWVGTLGFFACLCVSTYVWLNHGYFFNYQTDWRRIFFSNCVGLCGFLMLFVVFDPRTIIARALNWSFAAVVGIVSYEWYLFHMIFLDLSKLITGENIGGSYPKLAVRILFTLVLSFPLCAFIYRAFSLPILRSVHARRKQ